MSEKIKHSEKTTGTFDLDCDAVRSGQDLVYGFEVTLRASLPQSRDHSK
jgi:hypothetical protein